MTMVTRADATKIQRKKKQRKKKKKKRERERVGVNGSLFLMINATTKHNHHHKTTTTTFPFLVKKHEPVAEGALRLIEVTPCTGLEEGKLNRKNIIKDKILVNTLSRHVKPTRNFLHNTRVCH
jgi:hypothetical protein